MNLEKVREFKSSIILFAFTGAIFYLLNGWTPEYLDDYLYKYMFIGGEPNPNYPIHSINDIILSQENHYFYKNGRFIIHFLVQLFTGILGKPLFNIINTIFFILLLYSVVKFTNKNKTDFLFVLTISLTLFFFFIPAFNQTCLWLAGSMNYMWAAFSTLLYLHGIRKMKSTRVSFLYACPIFLLGIPTGATHEGITFPLALGSITYCIIHRKTVCKSLAFPLIIGFVVGALLCTFSPATIARSTMNEGFSLTALFTKLMAGFILCTKLRIFYLLLILILIIHYLLKRPILNWIKENDILLLSIFFSFGIVFLSGFISSRTAFGLEFFSLLSLLKLISICTFNKKQKRSLLTLSILLLIVTNGIVLPYSYANYQEYKRLIYQIQTNDTDVIRSDEVNFPDFISRYIQTPLTKETDEHYFSYASNDLFNSYIAATYNRDSLAFIPACFLDDVTIHPEHYKEFYTNKEMPFYAKNTLEEKRIKEITFLLREITAEEIPIFIRPLAHRLQRYSATKISTDKYAIVKIDGKSYILVGKNKMIDNRVIDIEVIY